MPAPSVREYYDNNTRRFLRLGQHQRTRNIHQPLWPDGVRGVEQAVNWSNELVLQEAATLADERADRPLRVLDLGCGVGSSMFYLAQRLTVPAELIGVTISPVQAALAQGFCSDEPGGARCRFIEADFLALPELPPVHLAFAIEAFLHAKDASRFFAEVASRLVDGGRLVLIDDLLTERGAADGALAPRERRWLDDFRAGWLAGSLLPEREILAHARAAGLTQLASENLTPLMRLGRPRDRLIGLAYRLAAPQMRRSTYLRALSGGYAKQQCLKRGIVEYRRLVFTAGRQPPGRSHRQE